MSLQVTQAAISEILRLSRQGENTVATTDSTAATDVVAQLDFVPGGCAQQRYQLNFNPAGPEAQVIACGALSLSISPVAWPHVQQLTLDYVEDLMGGSFRFDNPHLPSACNCGQSFDLPQA